MSLLWARSWSSALSMAVAARGCFGVVGSRYGKRVSCKVRGGSKPCWEVVAVAGGDEDNERRTRERERECKLYIPRCGGWEDRTAGLVGRDRQHKQRPRACGRGQEEDTSRIGFELRERDDNTTSKVTDEEVPCLESKMTGPRWKDGSGIPQTEVSPKRKGPCF